MLNKWVSSVGSLKKEDQLVVSPLSKDEAAGGSGANRLQTTLLLLLQSGSLGPEYAGLVMTKPSRLLPWHEGCARKGLILLRKQCWNAAAHGQALATKSRSWGTWFRQDLF